MPYLEASQSGVAAVSLGYNIPAIATQVGGIPEQLPADTAYFLEKASPEALAEAINAATANAEEYLYKKQHLQSLADGLQCMGHRTKRFFQWSGKMGERF